MTDRHATLSWFLRRSGDALRDLEEADVELTRRDGPDLVLTTAPRASAVRDGLGTLARIIRAATDDTEAANHLARAVSSALPGAGYLDVRERRRFLVDVADGAATAAELGTTEPLARALARWRRTARARASARPVSAHETRPVSIPDDVDDPSVQKASGVVELPLRVRWSHPLRTYDMDDERQRRLVYEQVLSEGLDEDVRLYIDVDTLVADWDELVLPKRVRRAWAEWLKARRDLSLAC